MLAGGCVSNDQPDYSSAWSAPSHRWYLIDSGPFSLGTYPCQLWNVAPIVKGELPLPDGNIYGFVSELNPLQRDILAVLEVPLHYYDYKFLFDSSWNNRLGTCWGFFPLAIIKKHCFSKSEIQVRYCFFDYYLRHMYLHLLKKMLSSRVVTLRIYVKYSLKPRPAWGRYDFMRFLPYQSATINLVHKDITGSNYFPSRWESHLPSA